MAIAGGPMDPRCPSEAAFESLVAARSPSRRASTGGRDATISSIVVSSLEIDPSIAVAVDGGEVLLQRHPELRSH